MSNTDNNAVIARSIIGQLSSLHEYITQINEAFRFHPLFTFFVAQRLNLDDERIMRVIGNLRTRPSNQVVDRALNEVPQILARIQEIESELTENDVEDEDEDEDDEKKFPITNSIRSDYDPGNQYGLGHGEDYESRIREVRSRRNTGTATVSDYLPVDDRIDPATGVSTSSLQHSYEMAQARDFAQAQLTNRNARLRQGEWVNKNDIKRIRKGGNIYQGFYVPSKHSFT